jgi:MurNAc alpha-1-phosphate uridylyltransferase
VEGDCGMKAMILAAGYGKRMLPLTEKLPKPLLHVRGRALIEHHLHNLARAGFQDVVINLGHLGHMIETAIGNGSGYGLRIQYSPEGPDPLETGGGMTKALPLLGYSPFIIVNADIYCDYDFSIIPPLEDESDAHLVLVDTPSYKANGDFSLRDGCVVNNDEPALTYSGIALYHPRILDGAKVERFSIIPRLRQAIDNGQVSGSYHPGMWSDVGMPDRLLQLQ